MEHEGSQAEKVKKIAKLIVVTVVVNFLIPKKILLNFVGTHSVKKAGKSAHFFVGLQDRKAFMSCKH